MSLSFDLQERYSLCIAWSDGSFYKFFRVADYDSRTPTELKPSLLPLDCSSFTQKRDNPDTLYNKQITLEYNSRTEDYFLLEWRPNPLRPGRQLTHVFDYVDSFPSGLTPKEVIIADKIGSEVELHKALHEGFLCPGYTTKVFYLTYGEEGDSLLAIRCERDDFAFEDGWLKLKPKVSNFKGTIAAPKVRLSKQQIIWSRHSDTGKRGIYSQLGELAPIGRLFVWPLSAYAEEYVRWFINKEESVNLSRSDRQRLGTVIRQALDRPDMLEQYVGDDYDNREVEDFKLAIARWAELVEDPSRRIICESLIKDEVIHKECVRLALKDRQDLIDEKKKELADLEAKGQASINAKQEEIDSLESRVLSILSDIEDAEAKLQAARDERDEIRGEAVVQAERIASLRDQEERAISEIESNLALRLGLRAVAASVPLPTIEGATGASETKPKVSVGTAVEKTSKAKTLADAISKNMSRLGISSINGEADDVRMRAALAVVAGAMSGSSLAIPSPLASRIADALSIAISGRHATHIAIPTDFKNIGAVLDALPTEEQVLVFDNVIDPVNEPVLFTLATAETEQVFIFPFVSHGSARLLAKEAWDFMYMPCISSLVSLPNPRRDSYFFVSKSGLVPARIDADELAEEASELTEDLQGLGLAESSFLLPAMVKLLVEESNVEESGFFAIAQHLAMVSTLDGDAYDALVGVDIEDTGLRQLFVRLGYHAG